ncbi:MAG: hypothetical protein Kapaf2KO_07250 [Candidatus Kapaibacteriales bacterium]
MDLEGLRVLDLYSGCGSYTAEAVSRGADRVLSIDISPESLRYQANAYKSFGIEDKITIKKADAIRFIRKPGAFDSIELVFADPPFGLGLEDKFAESLCQISPDTNSLFVLEHRPAFSLKKYGSVKILKENTFGNSAYTIFQLTQKKT